MLKSGAIIKRVNQKHRFWEKERVLRSPSRVFARVCMSIVLINLLLLLLSLLLAYVFHQASRAKPRGGERLKQCYCCLYLGLHYHNLSRTRDYSSVFTPNLYSTYDEFLVLFYWNATLFYCCWYLPVIKFFS